MSTWKVGSLLRTEITRARRARVFNGIHRHTGEFAGKIYVMRPKAMLVLREIFSPKPAAIQSSCPVPHRHFHRPLDWLIGLDQPVQLALQCKLKTRGVVRGECRPGKDYDAWLCQSAARPAQTQGRCAALRKRFCYRTMTATREACIENSENNK